MSAEIVVPPVAAVKLPSANASDAVKAEDSPLASSSRFAPSKSGVQSHEDWKLPWVSAMTTHADGKPAGAPVAVLMTSRSTFSPGRKPLPVIAAV